jgi:hypothetical protein
MLSRGESAPIVFTKRPPRPPNWWRVLSPGPGEVIRVICLSHDIEGSDLHFIGRRSRVCTGKENGCRYCRGQKCHWEGFVFVWSTELKEICLLRLTDRAVQDCAALHSIGSLRCRWIEEERIQDDECGRCVLRIGDICDRPQHAPAEPDLREALSRMWHGPFQPEPPAPPRELQDAAAIEAEIAALVDAEEMPL